MNLIGLGSLYKLGIESFQSMILTRRFLSWIKTLGAETTAIDVLSVAPSSSCLAKVVAVSSLYWIH